MVTLVPIKLSAADRSAMASYRAGPVILRQPLLPAEVSIFAAADRELLFRGYAVHETAEQSGPLIEREHRGCGPLVEPQVGGLPRELDSD